MSTAAGPWCGPCMVNDRRQCRVDRDPHDVKVLVQVEKAGAPMAGLSIIALAAMAIFAALLPPVPASLALAMAVVVAAAVRGCHIAVGNRKVGQGGGTRGR